MFYGCSTLTSLNISSFKTDSVTNMSYMFSDCSSLTSLDISSFNTGNVTNMSYMFQRCSILTTIYAGDGWSTENVQSKYGKNMFNNSTKLVGGKGTAFDASHIDYTYARIDCGAETPGYFTDIASSDIKGITVESTIDGNTPVYDIGGRRIATPQKGMNIIGGKKVVIK